VVVRESNYFAVPEPLRRDERIDLVRYLRAPASPPRVESLPGELFLLQDRDEDLLASSRRSDGRLNLFGKTQASAGQADFSCHRAKGTATSCTRGTGASLPFVRPALPLTNDRLM
jgi:hypothetical protein